VLVNYATLPWANVADSHDLHKGMLIRLSKTKTGNNKWVQVVDPNVITLVRKLIAKTKPPLPINHYHHQRQRQQRTIGSERLFAFATEEYRRCMKDTCMKLGAFQFRNWFIHLVIHSLVFIENNLPCDLSLLTSITVHEQ
jgi:hypothetical protein